MKTIEIKTGSQTARFTTKSVTFDGREFFYANMSHVTNDVENHTYTFTCGDETKTLPYEEKDAKILNAIFSQVRQLEEKRHAAGENSEAHDNEKAEGSTDTAEGTQTAGNADDNADSSTAAADTQTADSADNADNTDSTDNNDDNAGDSTEAEASKDEKKPEYEPEKEKKSKNSFK